MKLYTIALFGEAEKGEYSIPYFCQTPTQLLDCFGHPPPDSLGIHYAIQALLFQQRLIFFRVREEGFSYNDYLSGLHFLKKQELMLPLTAICLPGVGNIHIIEAIEPICALFHTILIMNEADLFDYLTEAALH